MGGNRYKVIVEHAELEYCELKMKQKNQYFVLVGCKLGVSYPEEMSGDGGGFDAASLGAVHGTSDAQVQFPR